MPEVTNPGGKARAKLFMAPNPKSDFRKENRNNKKTPSVQLSRLPFSVHVCRRWDGRGVEGKKHG